MSESVKKVIKWRIEDAPDLVRHFQLAYFREKIDSKIAHFLSDLIFLIKKPDEKVYFRISLPDNEDILSLSANSTDWTFLFDYVQIERLIGIKCEYHYVVGYCETVEQTATLLAFSWNNCYENPVDILVAKEIDVEVVKSADERLLALHYPLIVKRGHDGSWVDIYCLASLIENVEDKIKMVCARYAFLTESVNSL